MVRTFGVAVLCLFLVSPGLANAQAPERPSFASRFKSLFSRRDKPSISPKTPSTSNAKMMKPESRPASQPVRVTTRSGSLRRPSPEQPSPVMESPTPTFAQPDRVQQSQPPHRLNPPDSAQKLSQPKLSSARPPIRDRAVAPAGYESQPPKKTMFSWFRGLWSRPKPAPTQTMSPPNPNSVMRRPTGGSSSIDPNRIYRGAREEPGPNAGQSSNFSETGVPPSKAQFQGRSGSRF